MTYLPRPLTLAFAITLLALATGCAQMPSLGSQAFAPRTIAPQAESSHCNEAALAPGQATRLTAIEQLLTDDKPYAALAQLDGTTDASLRARYLRAEALRRVGNLQAAQAAYEGLMNTCMSGKAHHGLGLVAARQGQLAPALKHLRQARSALPTDARVRNDLGYALLLANELPGARLEFLTALDLEPGDARAARNLVMLAFRQGDDSQAESLARRFGLDSALTATLRQQARALPSATS